MTIFNTAITGEAVFNTVQYVQLVLGPCYIRGTQHSSMCPCVYCFLMNAIMEEAVLGWEVGGGAGERHHFKG